MHGTTTAYPTRLDTRHLRHHAARAVRDRLGSRAPQAVLGLERAGGHVIIRLNSGGNALAVRSWLIQHGYRAACLPLDPDVHGAAVRVNVRENPQTRGRVPLGDAGRQRPRRTHGRGAVASS